MALRRFACAALACAGLLIATRPAVAAVPQFQDGDVVCWIGDSITHSRKYHGYVYLYYLTRFPDRKLRFYNAGIAGDSAGGAVGRFDWDIKPKQCNVATIMLGMNDIGRGNYGKENPSEDLLKRRQASLDGHHANMIKLVKLLQADTNPGLILITPTPYDDTADIPTENLYGCNAALGICGGYAKDLAKEAGGTVVDFHGPMTAINLEQQQADPKFTITGPDRVHPLDPGMLVAAWLFLKAQGVPSEVSTITIDAAANKVTLASNTTVTGLTKAGNGLKFTVAANCLPFPIEPSAKAALDWAPVIEDLDREMLQVTGLAAGTYALKIDGQEVAQYDAAALAAGVNLATCEATPQYQQALAVQKLNAQRHGLEVRLRSVAQIKMMLLRSKIDPDDDAAVAAHFEAWVNQNQAMGNINYFKGQFKNYQTVKPKTAEIEAQIDALIPQCRAAAQPKPHEYELTPVQ